MAASAEPKTRQLYEFGPFRLDPEKELLLREDETVPIAPKAFQMLLVLIRHNQQVVTKDDLMKTIWPDTFVEEVNLSRNVFLLRKALGESRQDHQYIVTVPGRGYRFAGDVKLVPDRRLNVVAASHTTVEVQLQETRPWGWIVVAAALLIAVAAGAWKLFMHRAPVLTEKDTVVLADFTNSTGDPVFDGTLRQGLAVQLEQSPFLSLISDVRIQQTLRLMNKPADARLTPDIAREICERTGSAATLESSIASLGTQYVLGVKAVNCRNGEILDEEQVQAARKEDVLHALTTIAINFRTRIGESRATIRQHNTPLEQATTPSLEALKAYSFGWQATNTQGQAAAIPFFRRAVEIDPQFAIAYAALALHHGSLGESGLALQEIRRAHELRDRASDGERFFIDAYYDGRGTGNLEKALQICEEWERAYPREVTPHAFSAGFIDPGLARNEKAAEEGEEAIRVDPDYAVAYGLLGRAYARLNRFDAAESVLRRLYERKVDIPEYLRLRFDLAFLKNDAAEMSRVAALAQENSDAQDWLAFRQAFVFAYAGRVKEALRMSLHAGDLAQEAGHEERSTLFVTPPVLWEAFFGNTSEARRRVPALLERPHGRETEYAAALALAISGDSSKSEMLAKDLEKQFPEDTSVRFSYLPTVRAVLALKRGEPAKAIEILQVVTPYDLASPRSVNDGSFGALYPIYVRGLSYLAVGESAQAISDFQKIHDHRGIVMSDPIGALAQLQLARAYALAGDKNNAKAEYREFLTLWANADPDLPVLQQAKAEYAKLN
jgi:eukaryotic-like serine/threonine-protein kinase